jgi:demethylmenaquinone methyltransferase/2-methoxy-6-polyprenyl-1,4-benzoquinol methylase
MSLLLPADPLLAEQLAYYRAVAPEYESLSLPGLGGSEVVAALEAFAPAGDVLELACGPGMWTEILLRHASSVTAVDGASEMLARARARLAAGTASGGEASVRFVHADLFAWRPDRRYDVVFFGFWLSHVPPERFAAFWRFIDDCLAPGGRVFFVDDAFRPPEELIEGEASSTIERRTGTGAAFRIVKVPYRPAQLEQQLDALGWCFSIAPTSGTFYWGAGARHARAALERPSQPEEHRGR